MPTPEATEDVPDEFVVEQFARQQNLISIEGFRSPTSSWKWGNHGQIYIECMGKIVVLMLDDLKKVDILRFL